jgi:GDP-4-dehydro-6-deoxy-D-mannose reductase
MVNKMPYRLLITGALGFVGRQFINFLLNKHQNIKILGVDLSRDVASDFHCQYTSVDLGDVDQIEEVLKVFSPTHIIHLAGLVGPGTLEEHIRANLITTDNFYRAVLTLNPLPKIIQAGSAAAYGWIRPEELPVVESQNFRPVGPYGVSKAAQDLLAASYFRAEGLPVIRARIFNLLGPGQSIKMVPMTFVHQFKKIKDGKAEKLKTGDVSPTRDFIDIRDVASALFSLVLGGRPGEAYNIAGENEVSIKSIIHMLVELTGMNPAIEVDAGRVRGSDVMRIYAECTKIKKHTNWSPVISLEASLGEMWQQVGGDG